MKTVVAFLIALLSLHFGFAQCIVDLGSDVHVCQQLQAQSFPNVNLGDSIAIANATAPYQYEWSIEPIEGILGDLLFASTFLDDTTSSNPSVLSLWEDSLTFFLKLKDVNEQVCYDTIIVSASLFGTHLGNASFYIDAGDAVQLFEPNVVSNYPTDSILWQPTTGLDDANAYRPWASPETSQNYGCIIWDSQGCMQEGSPFLYVNVSPVSVGETQSTTISIALNQNLLHLELDEDATFKLSDLQGRTILKKEVSKGKHSIPIKAVRQQLVVYSLITRDGTQKSGKLLLP